MKYGKSADLEDALNKLYKENPPIGRKELPLLLIIVGTITFFFSRYLLLEWGFEAPRP